MLGSKRTDKDIILESFHHLNFSPQTLTTPAIIDYIKQKYDRTVSKQMIQKYLGTYADRISQHYTSEAILVSKMLLDECQQDIQVARAVLTKAFFS